MGGLGEGGRAWVGGGLVGEKRRASAANYCVLNCLATNHQAALQLAKRVALGQQRGSWVGRRAESPGHRGPGWSANLFIVAPTMLALWSASRHCVIPFSSWGRASDRAKAVDPEVRVGRLRPAPAVLAAATRLVPAPSLGWWPAGSGERIVGSGLWFGPLSRVPGSVGRARLLRADRPLAREKPAPVCPPARPLTGPETESRCGIQVWPSCQGSRANATGRPPRRHGPKGLCLRGQGRVTGNTGSPLQIVLSPARATLTRKAPSDRKSRGIGRQPRRRHFLWPCVC